MIIKRLSRRPGPTKRGEGIVYLDPVTGSPRARTPTEDVALSGSGGGAPSGSAGGDLGGTYPNPTVSQARGIRETAGPTTLTVGPVADGQVLQRSGSTLIGVFVALPLVVSASAFSQVYPNAVLDNLGTPVVAVNVSIA